MQISDISNWTSIIFRTELEQDVTTAIRGVQKNSEENMHIDIKI